MSDKMLPIQALGEDIESLPSNDAYRKLVRRIEKQLEDIDKEKTFELKYSIGHTVVSVGVETANNVDMWLSCDGDLFAMQKPDPESQTLTSYCVIKNLRGGDNHLTLRHTINVNDLNKPVIQKAPPLTQYKILGKNYVTNLNTAKTKCLKFLQDEGCPSFYSTIAKDYYDVVIAQLTNIITQKTKLLTPSDKYDIMLASLFDKL